MKLIKVSKIPFFAPILLVLLVSLSILVHSDFFRYFDYETMLYLQKFNNPFVDYIFSIFTLMGSSEFILFVSVFFFAVHFFVKRRISFSVFLYILIYPLELLGKLLIYHPKPPITLNRYVFDFHMPSSFIVETSYSYPSGHMARTAFVVAFLLLLVSKSALKRKPRFFSFLLLSLYFLMMFISRIYLGCGGR